MMIIEKRGNIFTTKAQTIVNTINCVGVMGAGIAYEFRLRHKDMFERYVELCEKKQIDIGKLWIYKDSDRKILNFPTKYDWKYPTKEKYLHLGLQKFIDSYQKRGIESVAFPLLGVQKGGLSEEKSLEIMHSYLSKCDIDVEIWHFDPMAKDDLFEKFVAILQEYDLSTLKKESGVGLAILKKIVDAVKLEHINSMSSLLQIKGVGDKTIEKLFEFVMKSSQEITLLDFIEN
jgi:O-acetyl-ADP-ribose deacetylase (regulator of RNase III)